MKLYHVCHIIHTQWDNNFKSPVWPLDPAWPPMTPLSLFAGDEADRQGIPNAVSHPLLSGYLPRDGGVLGGEGREQAKVQGHSG